MVSTRYFYSNPVYLDFLGPASLLQLMFICTLYSVQLVLKDPWWRTRVSRAYLQYLVVVLNRKSCVEVSSLSGFLESAWLLDDFFVVVETEPTRYADSCFSLPCQSNYSIEFKRFCLNAPYWSEHYKNSIQFVMFYVVPCQASSESIWQRWTRPLGLLCMRRVRDWTSTSQPWEFPGCSGLAENQGKFSQKLKI